MRLNRQSVEIAQLKADLLATQAELKRRQKELRKEAEDKLALQAQLIDKLAKSRFTLKIRSTRIVWNVVNWEGDANVTREYRGLQTGEGLQLRFLKNKAFTSTPNSKFGQARLIPEKTSPGISMQCGEETENLWFFQINFPEDLTSVEGGADYAFEYSIQKGVLMTKEAAAEAYRTDPRPREAVYQINEVFNELLELEVMFPRGYPAKVTCLALINEVVHDEETKKLRIQETEQGIAVTVEKPLPGFWYLIEWDGPPEDEFRRLKAIWGNKNASTSAVSN